MRNYIRTGIKQPSPYHVNPLISDDNRDRILEAILKGMAKTIESGVSEYRIGSRSLKRWTINDIGRLLELTQQLQSPPVARRVIMSDL